MKNCQISGCWCTHFEITITICAGVQIFFQNLMIIALVVNHTFSLEMRIQWYTHASGKRSCSNLLVGSQFTVLVLFYVQFLFWYKNQSHFCRLKLPICLKLVYQYSKLLKILKSIILVKIWNDLKTKLFLDIVDTWPWKRILIPSSHQAIYIARGLYALNLDHNLNALNWVSFSNQ